MNHQTRCTLTVGSIIALAGLPAAGALAGATIHGVNSAATSTTLHGGDRELNTMGFFGSSTTFTDANFGLWADGSMSSFANGVAVGPFGWNDPIQRDMSTSGNLISGNPDRADNSTPFAGEAGNTGTLREVFGSDTLGYKNMSWIIDGELACGVERYTIDLFLADGQFVSGDDDDSTVEFAWLERGHNSDMNIYGIREDGSLTEALFLARGDTADAGWDLNTLEIGDKQEVSGAGVSLDESWTKLKGFRLEMAPGFDGTDIVAVGAMSVPAPGALALLGLAGLAGARSRRRVF